MVSVQCKGVEKDDLVIPLIDLTAYLAGDLQAETAAAVCHAFETSGFLYLTGHGISQDTIKQAFALSTKFFARPQHEKDSLAWTTPESNRGYVGRGREKLSDDPGESSALHASAPDLKETIEIGREGVPEHPNHWPDQLDDDGIKFTAFMKNFFLEMQQLNIKVMRAIARGLDLPSEAFFDSYIDAADNNMRLLHYPPVGDSLFAANINQVRAGAHSDYGAITLLLQDQAGGLEVLSPKGTWVAATPIPGTIVVNAGNLLTRWSNDRIKSTVHRVVQPKTVADGSKPLIHPARYSIAYFCTPNRDALIESLPTTWRSSEPVKKYPAVLAGDYLVQRLQETYVAS